MKNKQKKRKKIISFRQKGYYAAFNNKMKCNARKP